jgi:predicted  nucleic acid-binding Zn-ribbon protein
VNSRKKGCTIGYTPSHLWRQQGGAGIRDLFEAQKIETMIMEGEQKLLQAPKKLRQMEDQLTEVRDKIEKEKEIVEELEKERRKKEKELEGEKEKIKKLEVKLYDVKTNKESRPFAERDRIARRAKRPRTRRMSSCSWTRWKISRKTTRPPKWNSRGWRRNRR